MRLILLIPFSLANGKWISEDIENLQIFESCLLIWAASEICDDFLEGAYFVVADREDVEFGAVMQAIEHHNPIVVEWQVSEIDQSLQSLNGVDPIEAEIKPFEVG